jgi:hypothetical protein
MINALKNEIKRLSKKAFRKERIQNNKEQKYRNQFEKRTGIDAGLANKRKKQITHKHYDASYCARNANLLAKTIWYKVLNLQYEPIAAINYLIPKPDGSKRSIMAFSIPDAALANVVLRRARDRNLKRLSPSSFAYHPDKNVFDAIIALNSYDRKGKTFAVQIDFEKYFDSIPSWYLKEKINDASKLSLTPHEKHIFTAFLHHKYSEYDVYYNNQHKRRIIGTPQGSSVSLLLANIANHDLDAALSASSGKFVRFADDVVALCDNYDQAKSIEDCFFNHCQTSGLKLNTKKSPGIAIISSENQEMRNYEYFDYLGYRFNDDGLSIPDKTIIKIKQKISRLINLYLLYYLQFGFNPTRVSVKDNYDWDLLGLVYEIRNFLYGGLSEEEIATFLAKGKRLGRMQGLMGFYCLIENPKKLKELDGWMLNIIRRAMKKRNAILKAKYSRDSLTPNNIELVNGSWLNMSSWKGTNSIPNSKMPSFMRGWRAARKFYFTFGLENVSPPAYGHSSDIESFNSY